jgi:hypothetical protein
MEPFLSIKEISTEQAFRVGVIETSIDKAKKEIYCYF